MSLRTEFRGQGQRFFVKRQDFDTEDEKVKMGLAPDPENARQATTAVRREVADYGEYSDNCVFDCNAGRAHCFRLVKLRALATVTQ
jgi:hypothetical protein